MDDDLHDCNDLNLDNKDHAALGSALLLFAGWCSHEVAPCLQEQDEPLCEANTSLVMPSVKDCTSETDRGIRLLALYLCLSLSLSLALARSLSVSQQQTAVWSDM